MFVVLVNSIDASCHTQQVDAEYQVELLVTSGVSVELVEIVEKDTFNPPTI